MSGFFFSFYIARAEWIKNTFLKRSQKVNQNVKLVTSLCFLVVFFFATLNLDTRTEQLIWLASDSIFIYLFIFLTFKCVSISFDGDVQSSAALIPDQTL